MEKRKISEEQNSTSLFIFALRYQSFRNHVGILLEKVLKIVKETKSLINTKRISSSKGPAVMTGNWNVETNP